MGDNSLSLSQFEHHRTQFAEKYFWQRIPGTPIRVKKGSRSSSPATRTIGYEFFDVFDWLYDNGALEISV
jgi:hypothetical protein